MNKRPLIGITTYGRDENRNFYLPNEYVDSVRRAGGVPVLLTPGETDPGPLINTLDGILFAGGGDFAPETYDGRPHPTIARVDAERDRSELTLARKLLSEKTPVLGICRGFQLLNIATGGDLIPDVPEQFGDQVIHRKPNCDEIEHEVNIHPGCRLAHIFESERIPVMSQHHQALGKIPGCWSVTAEADDKVIEGIEHKEHDWMMAVLWHPELAPDDRNQQRLFEAFVEAARRYGDETSR